jgi:hypothetical protein
LTRRIEAYIITRVIKEEFFRDKKIHEKPVLSIIEE